MTLGNEAVRILDEIQLANARAEEKAKANGKRPEVKKLLISSKSLRSIIEKAKDAMYALFRPN